MADVLGTIYAELRLRIDRFKQDIAEASTEIKTLEKGVSENMNNIATVGNGLKSVGGAMSKYVTAPIVAMGTASVYVSQQFEEAMSEVKAVSNVTGEEFNKLKELAMEMGAKTKFSALEAANAMFELMKAGFDANEIMSVLPATLDLAAAGGVGLAEASKIVAQSMNMFGETADQTSRYADVFAKAAAIGALDVTTLAEALSYAGPSAAAMGYSLEETAAILAVFSDAGIESTRAGTTFEAMLRDMKKNALESGGALKFVDKAGKEVSISMYDAHGNIRPMVDILADLERATAGMSDAQRDAALANVANTQGLRGLNVLLGKGSEYLANYTQEIYNSSGAGEKMATTMQDNLAGSLEQLNGSLETAGIALGEVLTPVIRDIADGIRKLVDWFTALEPETKKVIVVFLAVVAAVGPLLFMIGALLTALPAMAAGWGIVSAAMAPVIVPILAIVAAIAAVIAIGVLLYKNWDTIKAWAGKLWTSIKDGWESVVEGIKGFFSGLGEWFQNIWNDISTAFSNGVTAVVTWFTSLPEKIGTALAGLWSKITEAFGKIVEWFASLPEKIGLALSTLWTKITETFNQIVEFLVGLPAKIGEFLVTFFTETLPYWVGYGIGTMVRLIGEGIQAVVTFFTELPGKVVTFLTTLATNIATWATEVWTTMTTWVSKTVTDVVAFFAGLPAKIWTWLVDAGNKIVSWGQKAWTDATTWVSKTITSVVAFFAELPGKIWTWLTNTVTKIVAWGNQVWNTATTWVSKTVTSVVSFFASLPEKIWTWLVAVVNKVLSFGTNLEREAKNAANKLWNGFVSIIKGLPGKVSEIFWDVVNAIKNFGSRLWDAATSIASNLWEGFKDGLGIHSPSYIEVAMKDILTRSGEMVNDMKRTFGELNQLKVNPPSLAGVASSLNTAITDLSASIAPTVNLAYAGMPTAPVSVLGKESPVQKIEVYGEVDVKGYTDKGQYIDTHKEIIKQIGFENLLDYRKK